MSDVERTPWLREAEKPCPACGVRGEVAMTHTTEYKCVSTGCDVERYR